MRYSLQNEYGYSGTIRYRTPIYGRIAGVRVLYGRILCGRRILFELQYSTSTVQSYKFEYSTSKRRGLSTVRYPKFGKSDATRQKYGYRICQKNAYGTLLAGFDR